MELIYAKVICWDRRYYNSPWSQKIFSAIFFRSKSSSEPTALCLWKWQCSHSAASNLTTQFCSLCQSNFFASCKTCIVISSERCVVLKPFVSILAFCRNSPIHFVSSEPIFSGTTAGDNERHDCIGTCKVEGLRVGMYFARILHLEWIGKRMKNKENFFWFM